MYREDRTQLMRLTIISAAWALGEALTWQMGATGLGVVVPGILAAAAYLGTRDMGGPPGGGSGAMYWRGRRIDRDGRR